MSPTTLAGIDPPDLVSVEVNVPAMERVEGVGQHPALPIKRLAVAVVPGVRTEIETFNKKEKLCKFDFVFLLN